MSVGETNLPQVRPFTYVLIPCDETKSVVENRFDGHGEEALRSHLTRHFRQALLSPDQMKAMSKHILEQSKKSVRQNASEGINVDPQEANNSVKELNLSQQKHLIDSYLEQASYEIIPVTMPMRNTKFVGTSLYVDDSGAFKDLPVNCRASHIAQREIRGDAFLLSNHDDPALDIWERVDCTLAAYNALYAEPPKTHYDTSDRAQMAQAAMLREEETKRVGEEDVLKAQKSKDDGNRYFAAADLQAAVQAYSLAVELTEGRRDLLLDEKNATALHISALLNRSLCFHRLGKYSDAAKDAEKATLLDGTSPKAYYRLAQALISSRDFAEARRAVQSFAQWGGSSEDLASMWAAINSGERTANDQLKKQLARMFK